VKPERDLNRRSSYAEKWWVFGEPRRELRPALSGLKRFIATPATAKHRIFCFVDEAVLPDDSVITVAVPDSVTLGVLSCRFHLVWALARGSTLENRPRYVHAQCFDPFPFPDANDAQKDRIRHLAEHLDAHRKQVQATHPDVTLTGMYNGLERAREAAAGGPALSPKERAFHDTALIGVLRSLHDDLDAAVADAYGWPVDLPDDEVLTRLVSLNAIRAAEEAQGTIRWLRPDFQRARAGLAPAVQQTLDGMDTATPTRPSAAVVAAPVPWPKDRFQQIKAVRDIVAARPGTCAASDITGAFTGAVPATVRRHLDMLERIGVLVAYDDATGRRWHAGAL